MQSKASTVRAYLASLPADRRKAIEAVRAVILKNLDKKIEEGMQYGMIGYYVPHSVFPAGYHCDPKQPLPYAGLASQKQHMSVYLMGNYVESDFLDWFLAAWKKTGKKLDMGKCCIRFKKLDDLALDVIGEAVRRLTVKRYVEKYMSVLEASKNAKPGKAARSSTGATTKKKAAPTARKKTAQKIGASPKKSARTRG